jgi:hypothetical protein
MAMVYRQWRRLTGCGLAVLLGGCSRSNNLLLGRVEATVGEHTVVVTDCYRTSVPAPEALAGPDGSGFRFTPCRDANVEIRGGRLIVNGRSYGTIGRRDAITVDHGRVLVNDRTASVQ